MALNLASLKRGADLIDTLLNIVPQGLHQSRAIPSPHGRQGQNVLIGQGQGPAPRHNNAQRWSKAQPKRTRHVDKNGGL